VMAASNKYKGPRARTFAEVAGRPPAPLRTGKESAGGAGVKNINRGKGRNANGRNAYSINMPGLPWLQRCTAVSLTRKDGSGFTYRNAMSVVKGEIKLSDLDIADVRPRKAVTGAPIFEIAVLDSGSKASRLTERMACALRDFAAKVTVLRRTAELRVIGLEDSVIPEEVVAAVADAGGCALRRINVGVIRAVARSLDSVWLRCSLTAARKVSGSNGRRRDVPPGGKLRIGWSTARVSPLPTRRLPCFKCLESGHVRRDCASTVDRSDRCYRCGTEGHRARDCLARIPKCPICADLGLPASHCMESPACKPPARKRRAIQEARIVPDEVSDTTASKETTPSTGSMEARRGKEKVGCTDREGNGSEEAMKTELPPT
jgi:hypothetical protein